MIPKEALDFKEKNEKFGEFILKSLTGGTEEIDKAKVELSLMPTPKETIYTECSVKLYRFTPVKKKLHPVPLIIVPSLILRYYIMDLIKGHSLIENLVNQGIDTYLIDWGVPGDEHGLLTFDYYVDTFLRRAVRQVSRRTGAEKINMLGQCLGGTIAAVFTSLYPDKINRLGLLTTPVDFEDAGLLALWTDKSRFNVDKVVDSFGSVVPPDFIHACFQFLDTKATVERYKKLFNNVLDENFLYYYRSMDTWLSDKIPFPGEVFRKFIKGLYQENELARGIFPINGRNADLANIKCPVINVVAELDHVFPRKSALATASLAGGPVETHVIPAGHVTLVALFPVREETYKLFSDFFLRTEENEKKKPAPSAKAKKATPPAKEEKKKATPSAKAKVKAAPAKTVKKETAASSKKTKMPAPPVKASKETKKSTAKRSTGAKKQKAAR